MQKKDLKEAFKIPLPPLDIQAQIVDECKKIDAEYKNSRMAIEAYRGKIIDLYEHLYHSSTQELRIDRDDLFEVSIGKRVTEKELIADGRFPVYSANVKSPFGRINESLLLHFDVPSVLWGIDGDWMTHHLPANYLFHPTDHCGVLRLKKPGILKAPYLAFALGKRGEAFGFSRAKRASIERIKGLSIPVPPYEKQREMISEIEAHEAEILKLENIMKESAAKKKALLQHYLS